MNSNDDDLQNLLNSDDEDETVNEYDVGLPKMDNNDIQQMVKELQQMSDKDRNNFLENIMNNFNINDNDNSFNTTDPKERQRLKLKQKINNSRMKRQGKTNLKNTLNKVKNDNLSKNEITNDNNIEEINKKKKKN